MTLTRRTTTASLLGLGLPALTWAQSASVRIGTVVPKNSLYHQQLMELGEAWRAAQGAGCECGEEECSERRGGEAGEGCA